MEITNVATAQSKSQSLRTTIPAGIVRQFGLKPKDQLSWELVVRANKMVIEVRPMTHSEMASEPGKQERKKGAA